MGGRGHRLLQGWAAAVDSEWAENRDYWMGGQQQWAVTTMYRRGRRAGHTDTTFDIHVHVQVHLLYMNIDDMYSHVHVGVNT